MDLAHLCRSYGAARALLREADGRELSATGTGHGLTVRVDEHGVGPLAANLADGAQLMLEDEGVELWLRRDGDAAVLRVSWGEGPSYEDRIPVVPGLPLPADPGGAVVHQSIAAASPRGAPLADLLGALHDAARPLSVAPEGVFDASAAPGHALVPAVRSEDLGSAAFRAAHGLRHAYVAGAMAGGIASKELVVAMGRAGMLGFYGAGGVPLPVVEENIVAIKAALGDAPCGANLLHNPIEPHVEEGTVDLYLKHGVSKVSASAYMRLTPAVVRYRLHGIHRAPDGRVVCPNSVFAKVSRTEVAEPFFAPAPAGIVEELVKSGALTPEQAALAALVPVAEDVTAEADSGGHTDRRPLVVLLPTLLALRDRVMAEQGYAERGIELRVGAAGGLGDPSSVAAALAMGADYVLTGSINQSSLQADTSAVTKAMVAAAGMADVAEGAAPDMFEIGAHVQVLSRGSMYAQRANKLYQLYKAHPSLEAIPEKERKKLEKSVFKAPLSEVWAGTRAYWAERDPREVAKAEADPRHQMALTFRWYLGMSSRWARMGTEDRKRDFQIWCGPSMGRFNDWVRGTWLEPLEARDAVAMAHALLRGAAVLRRVQVAQALGVALPAGAWQPAPAREA